MPQTKIETKPKLKDTKGAPAEAALLVNRIRNGMPAAFLNAHLQRIPTVDETPAIEVATVSDTRPVEDEYKPKHRAKDIAANEKRAKLLHSYVEKRMSIVQFARAAGISRPMAWQVLTGKGWVNVPRPEGFIYPWPQREKLSRHHLRKHTIETAERALRLYTLRGWTLVQLARHLDVSIPAARNIVLGKTYAEIARPSLLVQTTLAPTVEGISANLRLRLTLLQATQPLPKTDLDDRIEMAKGLRYVEGFSAEECAASVLEERGTLAKLSAISRRYFDFSAYAYDLRCNGWTEVRCGGQTFFVATKPS